jgi:uncharacterized protein
VDYRRRVVDDELDELIPELPAIALEGAKAVGKTATALQRSGTVHRLDEPGQREVARADPARLSVGTPPILLDEWQRVPESWDLVRRAVDENPAGGRFLLTGSATPVDQPTHSGAGRITTVRMRPLSLAERGLADPTVRLSSLLAADHDPVQGETDVTLENYVDEIVASGFPAIRGMGDRARRAQLDGYIERIIEHDFEEMGNPVRNEGALRRWMTAYAAATSTTASFETIRDAATSGHGDKPSKPTVIPYRNTLERLWIVDDVPAWLPSRSHIRRLGEAPKHQLADPALATRLLGVGPAALLNGQSSGPSIPRDGTLLGTLFESLVTLSLRVYAQAGEARVHHLRTHGGEREVDLIVAREDQRVVAIEVKLAGDVDDGDVRNLHWLREQIGGDLLDAIVVTTGSAAYRRADGIAVVPAALLGP